jgi:recombination protein RecA
MIKQGDKVVGNQTKVKVIKNKIAAPFQVAEFEIIFGVGICRIGELLDFALANKIVNRTGAWYSFQNEKIGQGKENAKKFLNENQDILEKIEKLTLEAIAPKGKEEAKEIKEASKN